MMNLIIVQVDVYALGNIFYMLLQEEWPFQDLNEKEAQERVMKGLRPSFDENVWNSTDLVDQALKQAMLMCHEQNAADRASAREVESFLKGRVRELMPGSIVWMD